MTAVLGQQQMGKSWLLLEVARRLSTEGWSGQTSGSLSLRGLPPTVGHVESEGRYADMLPRAVQDLYQRWLANQPAGGAGVDLFRAEEAVMIVYVRTEVQAAEHFSDEELLEQIGNHPGVLDHWTSEYGRNHLRTATI